MDLGEKLQSLVDSSGFAPLAFFFAFVAGAAHAVGPGHGKSLAAAYLVGSSGRLRDAAWLSGSVAIMHTLSVLAVAVAWTFYSLSDLVRLETLTTCLQLAAGLLALGTGVWLLTRHLRGKAVGMHSHGGIMHSHAPVKTPAKSGAASASAHSRDNGHGVHGHSHAPDVHSQDDHSHAHAHDDEHSHSHELAHTHSHAQGHSHSHGGHDHSHDHDQAEVLVSEHDHPVTKVRRPGLLMLGAAGGLVPSPTAFLVLVTGFFSGHAAFALLLVITFGLGMAVVLFGVGLLALGGSSLITRGAKSRSILRLATRVAPAIGAAAITVVGCVITVISVASLASA